VFINNRLVCVAEITCVKPHWGSNSVHGRTGKISAQTYTEIHAERPAHLWDKPVARAYMNESIHTIVRDLINRTPGAIHYTVRHREFPEGAAREYQKFLSRKTPENELQRSGIQIGQWVSSNRIDYSQAYAKDGDTISGLKVDGVPWPDVRLMLIDAEETARNAHATKRHPEVALWTDERYLAGPYKRKADAARDQLAFFIDTYGIDAIELNPHRNTAGEFDDRVDSYGRYLGLVYGGGICFNAALVEYGLADVFLYEDGRYLDPDLQLKDFFSYAKQSSDSVEPVNVHITRLDVKAPLYETLTALAYAARGYVWSVAPDGAVTFRQADIPDRVIYLQPERMTAALGACTETVVNRIHFQGNPVEGPLQKTYFRDPSQRVFGAKTARLDYFGISRESDADALVAGILDDVAYPEAAGSMVFHAIDTNIAVGDLLELRGDTISRQTERLEEEWGNLLATRYVGRVKHVGYTITGEFITTEVQFTSPLRSVDTPLALMVRSQPAQTALYQFRLDDNGVGLDLGFHLD